VRWAASIGAVAVALAACGDNTVLDAGPDSSADAAQLASDAAPDGMLGGPIDASADATIDSAVDAGADASPDAAAVADASPDASVDATPDASVDANPDASVDANPDARVDAIAFTQAVYDFGVRPAGMSTSAYPPTIELQNQTAATLQVTLSVPSPFSLVSSTCDSVAPGATCSVAIDVLPNALGAITGTLTATAPGYSAQTVLVGTAEAFVAGDTAGAGTGTVSATPPGDACNAECYQGGAVVTLTATPAAGSHLSGWSVPSCGTALTCVVTAGVDPQVVVATFDLDPPVGFEVDFAGDAPGEVSITQADQASGPIATCAASCTALVKAGEDVWVTAATSASFVDWSAPCSGMGQFCDAPAGTASVTVTFDGESGEQDLYVGTGIVYSADYDSTGDLVVGTSDGVVALSPSLVTLWTAPFAGEARLDAAGEVFVLADQLYKLDATGHVLWAHASAAPPATAPRMGHIFAPTPAGGVVVDVGGMLEIWTPDGTLIATPVLGAVDHQSVAVDSTGVIYAGVEDADAESTDLEVFSPTGARLPDFGRIAIEYRFALAIDASDTLVGGSSGFGKVDVHRVGVNHTEAFWNIVSSSDPAYVPNAVATDATGDVVSEYAYSEESLPVEGMVLRKLSPSGTIVSSISRPGFHTALDGPWGLQVFDVAASPAGHIAVVGRYFGMTPRTRGIIEVFP
jgi:hypothetical protein